MDHIICHQQNAMILIEICKFSCYHSGDFNVAISLVEGRRGVLR